MFINVRPRGPANLPQGCRTTPGRNRPGLWALPKGGFGTPGIASCPPRGARCPPRRLLWHRRPAWAPTAHPTPGAHLSICPHSTPAPRPCAHTVTQPPTAAQQPSIHPPTPNQPPSHLLPPLTPIRPPPTPIHPFTHR